MAEYGTAAVNGVTLHYYTAGRGKPVLLVHGNGEDHTLFETQIRQLTMAGYRVIAPDSRGHGKSSPVAEYHYADMAEDMYCLIQDLDLDRPAYYGHSDGGIIGLLLAMAHPEALGLMAVSGTNLSPQGLRPDFLAAIAEESGPLITLMETEPHIAPESLEKIAVPVLVTAGSDDLVLPEETDTIASHLPRGQKVIVDGSDHGSYIAGSEIMGRLLKRFFAENGY